MVKEERGVYKAKTTAARADIIAHSAKRTITENMDKDPAFYEKFSKLIQDAIDGFKNQRISDLEYLQKVSAIRDEVANTQRDDVPDSIRDNEEASAYFGAIKPCLTEVGESRVDYVAAQTALAIKSALEKNWKVDFWNDSDAQNAAKNEMDDFFYDVVKDGHGIDLSSAQMDEDDQPNHEDRQILETPLMLETNRTLAYAGESIPFHLSYSKRKTLEIAVHPDCSVVVKAPLGEDETSNRRFH